MMEELIKENFQGRVRHHCVPNPYACRFESAAVRGGHGPMTSLLKTALKRKGILAGTQLRADLELVSAPAAEELPADCNARKNLAHLDSVLQAGHHDLAVRSLDLLDARFVVFPVRVVQRAPI